MLILHIIIALSSLGYTAYTYLSPSRTKLNMSYTLVALTLFTGSVLIVMSPAHMVSSCVTGLVYLGFVGLGIVSARHKLAKKYSE